MKADQDSLKRRAAMRAVQEVEDGMVLGLGTGTTVRFVLEALAERVAQGMRLSGIPTSAKTAGLARQLGIPLTDFAAHRRIDLTIDGADEVERGSLTLIKGGGGALLREKIVASASTRVVIVADRSKLVDRLGAHFPLPVEIVAFGWETVFDRLAAAGIAPSLRKVEGKPFVTDGGNHIADCATCGIPDPGALEKRLKAMTGVVEVGIFVGLASTVIVAGEDGVEVLERPPLQGAGTITVLMGVTGSGKTTIGKLLAERTGVVFADGDDYHPAANKAKMAAGHPLTDEDRQPWLEALNGLLQQWRGSGKGGVLACSALKEQYRQMLAQGMPAGSLRFVMLDAPKDLLADRLAHRHHEYMNPSLLSSQLETLELPKNALVVMNDRAPGDVVNEILQREIGRSEAIGG